MKWINVNNKLPENEDMVLIFPEPDFDEPGRMVLGFYTQYDGGTNGVKKDNWCCFDSFGYEFQLKHITYWMPLPKTPARGGGR